MVLAAIVNTDKTMEQKKQSAQAQVREEQDLRGRAPFGEHHAPEIWSSQKSRFLVLTKGSVADSSNFSGQSHTCIPWGLVKHFTQWNIPHTCMKSSFVTESFHDLASNPKELGYNPMYLEKLGLWRLALSSFSSFLSFPPLSSLSLSVNLGYNLTVFTNEWVRIVIRGVEPAIR